MDATEHGSGGDPSEVAAFFDLDKTVIKKAAMVAFAKPLYDAGFITRRLLVQAAYNNLRFKGVRGPDAEKMAEFRETGLRIVKGWDARAVRDVVEVTLEARIAPSIYPAALTTIRSHQAAGRRVFLISAEPAEIVEPLGQRLGVDHTICSEASIGADGRYTGETARWIYGPEKAVAMREAAETFGIDLTASYAYSDSATDEPMLSCVGHPVAVNPDRGLLRIATARGWEIQRFQLEPRSKSSRSDRPFAYSR